MTKHFFLILILIFGFSFPAFAQQSVMLTSDSAGNIGIGTSGPITKLQVVGTVTATAFSGDGSGLTGVASGGGWTDGGTNVYTSTTTDNVGIGTTTPTGTLEVVKTAASTAPLMVSSTAAGDGNFLIVNSEGNVGIGTVAPRGGLVVMNGNVGIGTTAPSALLALNGGTTAALGINFGEATVNLYRSAAGELGSDAYGLVLDKAAAGSALLQLGNGASSQNAQITYNNAGDNYLTIATNYSAGTGNRISFLPGGTERVRFQQNGNVGIGTTTPVGGLTVMTGNVGIGTWSARSSLEIKGDMLFSGANSVRFGGTTSSFPQIGPNGADIFVTLADGSAFTDFGVYNLATLLDVSLGANGVVGFLSTPTNRLQSGSVDSGFARLGAAMIGVGNGAQSDSSGTLVAKNIGIGTTLSTSALSVMSGNVGIGTWDTSGVSGILVTTASTGNVGIGTIRPGTRLDVNGTVRATAFSGDGSLLTGVSAGGWTDGGTNVFTSLTTDNVGIGTTTPTSTLEIVKTAAGTAPLMVSSTAAGDGNFLIVNSEGNVGIGTVAPRGGLVVMNGNVGIGTTVPVYRLEVVGGDGFTSIRADQSVSAGGFFASEGTVAHGYFYNSVSNGGMEFTAPGTYTARIYAGSGGNVALQAGSGDVVTVTSGGNVGIGTLAPGSKLSVSGGAAIGSGSAYTTLTAPTNGMMVQGAVGIGTTAPTGNLDVRGDEARIWTGAGTDTNATAAGELYVEGDLEVDGTIYGDGSGITGGTIANAGGWTDGGTNVYTSTTTDNVGIGTTTPTSTLEIVKTAAGTAPLMVSSTATSDGNMFIVSSSGNVGIGTTNNDFAALSVMSGNVGIGTWKPSQARLTVQGVVGINSFAVQGVSGSNTIINEYGQVAIRTATSGEFNMAGRAYFYDAGSGNYENVLMTFAPTASQTGHLIQIGANNGSSNVFTAFGNLGLGTINPLNRLVVNGGVGIGTLSTSSFINNAAPAGGLIVENNVGIGTTTPVAGLAVMNGNVGIGTWSPIEALQITAGRLALGDSSAPGTTTNKMYAVAGNLFWNGTQLDTGATLSGWTDGGTNVYTSTTTDNVGIGTTTPTSTLEIVKTAAGTAPLMVSSTAAGDGNFLIVNSEGNVGIGTVAPRGGLVVMNGNVGIGTWNPVNSLSVVGNIGIGTYAAYRTIAAPNNGMMIEGNVGIGTWTSSFSTSRLQVVGGLTVRTGNIVAYDSLVVNGGTYYLNYTGAFRSGRIDDNAINVGIGTTLQASGLAIMTGNVGIGTWVADGVSGSLIVAADVGNVGIGTIRPGTRLDVNGTVRATAFSGDGSLLTGISAGGWTDGGTNVYTSATTDNVGIGTTTPTATLLIENVGTIDSLRVNDILLDPSPFVIDANGNVGIGTSLASEKLIIPSGNVGIGTLNPVGGLVVMTGNVGVGTWSPTAALHVGGGGRVALGDRFRGDVSSSAKIELSDSSGTNSNFVFDVAKDGEFYGQILFASSQGTVASRTQRGFFESSSGFYAGNSVGALSGYTWDSSAFRKTAEIDIMLDGAPSSGDTPGAIAFQTTPAGSVTPLLRMFIKNSGNVGIGTAKPVGGLTVMNGNVGIGTWSPTSKLQVVGTVTATAFSGDGSGLSNISAGGWTDGGTNVYTTLTTDNVGIGTTTPNAATLEIVKNAAQPPFKISSVAGGNGDYLVVASNGNIGIGTLTPQTFLHVRNPGVSSALRLDQSTYLTGNNQYADLIFSAGGDNSLDITTYAGYSGNRISLVPGQITVLTALKSGVGIGTTTPVGGLVVMNGNVGIGTWNPANASLGVIGNVAIGTTLPYLTLAAPQAGMFVEGNVGIGTWSPGTYKLFVNGEGRFGNDVTVNGNVVAGYSNYLYFGDTTTGIRGSGSSDDITFRTNAATRMSIDSSGNVGIGTTASVAGLAVMSGNVGIGTWSVDGVSGSLIVAAGVGNVGIGTIRPGTRLDVNGTVRATAFSGDGSLLTGISAGGWTDGGTNVFTSLTTDNVGIGTTTPTSTLEVVKTAAGTAPLMISTTHTADGDYLMVSSTGRVGIGTTKASPIAGLSVMNGNVGIGTWNPRAQLEIVEGDLRLWDAGQNNQSIKIIDSNNATGFNLTYVNSDGSVTFDAAYDIVTADIYFRHRTNGTAVTSMALKATGSVGIGTTFPVSGTAIMNGNVGIGTWSPSRKFELRPESDGGGMMVTESDGATSAVFIKGNSSSGAINIFGNGSGTVLLNGLTTSDSYWNAGNLGMGTTTPIGALTIMNGNVGIGTWNVNGISGSLIVADGVGNVGIGTIRPGTRLDVNGTVRATAFTGTANDPAFNWVLEPQNAKLPASNPAAIDAANNRWRLLFDASTAESATWEGVLRPYQGGALKADVLFSMASGESLEVEWLVSIDCYTPTTDTADIDTEGFGTVDSLVTTVSATAGELYLAQDVSLNGDTCAEGDFIVVKVTTDATDAVNDDATGDRELRKVVIYE